MGECRHDAPQRRRCGAERPAAQAPAGGRRSRPLDATTDRIGYAVACSQNGTSLETVPVPCRTRIHS